MALALLDRLVWSVETCPALGDGLSRLRGDHRIPAWQGLAGTSVGHPAQPPAQAGSPGVQGGCLYVWPQGRSGKWEGAN